MPGDLDEATVRLMWMTSAPTARAHFARDLRRGAAAYDPDPLVGRYRLATCADDTCARLFATTHARQRYCCPDCRRRFTQRRYYWASPTDRARRITASRSARARSVA